MPISYPANLPTSGVTSLSWTNATASLISRSPFTFQGQSQSYPGAIRFAKVTVENLNRVDAEDWVGFLDSLFGTKGTFRMGDPAAVVPMGRARGTATVVTSSGDRTFITLSSTDSNGNDWLKRGDWIQLGTGLDSRLYKAMRDQSLTDGTANLPIWPPLRKTPVVGDTVYLENTKGLFRRSSATFDYTQSNDCRYSLSFDCEEVI